MPRLNETAALRFAVRIALASSVFSFSSYAANGRTALVTTPPAVAPSPTDNCDKADISGKIRVMAGALHHCYAAELAKNHQLAGKIVVEWTIQTDGRVNGEKTVTDTMGNPAVARCLMATIASIRFQKVETGICVIQWPFVFSPG